MKTVKVGPFLGLNNRRSDFALHVKDRGDYVSEALNIEFDDLGNAWRFAGLSAVQAMAGSSDDLMLSPRQQRACWPARCSPSKRR